MPGPKTQFAQNLAKLRTAIDQLETQRGGSKAAPVRRRELLKLVETGVEAEGLRAFAREARLGSTLDAITATITARGRFRG
jgi:hypothetical protein